MIYFYGEIVGYLGRGQIEEPKVVGKKIKYDLQKFIVNNGHNRSIQCCIWGKEVIAKHQDVIKENNVRTTKITLLDI